MVSKGIVYYTDNRCEERITTVCRRQIFRCTDMPIVSVSHYPIDFGKNFVVNMPRGALSMFTQILKGLENTEAEIVYLCEHDVLYHPSHFDFVPDDRKFHYNLNRWQLCSETGRALFRITRCTSLCVAFKSSFLRFYSDLIKVIERGNYKRSRHGFAPNTHKIPGTKHYGKRNFKSEQPCIDIRHPNTYTGNRWEKTDFRNSHSKREWKESDEIPGWGKTKGRFDEFLREVDNGKF